MSSSFILCVVAALAAATATPALFSLAAQLAPPERLGLYVAAVAFGVTGAIALGVPAGTWIGGALGWRAGDPVRALGRRGHGGHGGHLGWWARHR
ncbi:MFS transporter [Sinosporangium album]|nr:MFS transporter [Sinosporangium album]